MAEASGLSVVFLCQHSNLSSIAATFAAKLGPAGAHIRAAGVDSVDLDPLVPVIMQEVGVELDRSVHRVADLEGESFDVVVTVTPSARRYCLSSSGCSPDARSPRTPVFAGLPICVHWNLDEPPRKGGEQVQLRYYRAVRDKILQNVEGLTGQGTLTALIGQRRRWEQITDSCHEGLIAHDVHRHIFLFNRAAELITGRARDAVLGRDCHVIFPGGLCGAHCSYRSPGKPATSLCTHDTIIATPEGQRVHLKVNVEPLDLAAGEQWGSIARIVDSTELDRLCIELGEERGMMGMIGTSPRMVEVFDRLEHVGATDYPVLISGESGTGKELLARAIHMGSRRRGGPFVPVNCGALPDGILASELFGHVRGAFTGAVRNRKGRFELADKGTLFLDEVGELAPPSQVKLLRVLQEMTFHPVGGERPVKVDVRVISATNRDLRTMVAEGRFREDLYYRLCVVPFDLPPLRQRREDIPLLVEHALERVSECSHTVHRVDGDAMEALLAYDWPGNVRELLNALQFASVLSSSSEIKRRHLPPEVQTAAPAVPAPEVWLPPPPGPRRKLNRAAVEQAMERAHGNKTEAARILGVGRATLYRFIKAELKARSD